jgi:DNA (cytosine-5)-methyltransferase 1
VSRTPGNADLFQGLVVDSFAGGGGASIGIERALGRPVDVAINHSDDAIAMHEANHPHTRHFREDIWEVDPIEATRGRPVDLAWFSPDCTHFSRAKGARPCSPRIRGLAWVVVRWARKVRPRIILLENVAEFETWGPLTEEHRPCPKRQGEHFALWRKQLEKLGYTIDWRTLCAADYGAPTSRRRLFLVARCDGAPIRWPEPTHGPGRVPYRTAAEIIDWSLPCPSIFLTPDEARAVGCRRPLAEKTMARIAAGIRRYVLEHPDPFVVDVDGHPAAPFIAPRYGERPTQTPRTHDVRAPVPTIVPSGNGQRLVAAWLAQHNGGMVGHDAREPFSTITGKASHQQLVTADLDGPTDRRSQVHAFLSSYYGIGIGQDCRDPLRTITGRDRFGLVLAERRHEITDVGMRMFSVPELYRAQGFPDWYVTDVGARGQRLTKTAQLKLVGNSVCPDMSAALVRANVGVAAGSVAA